MEDFGSVKDFIFIFGFLSSIFFAGFWLNRNYQKLFQEQVDKIMKKIDSVNSKFDEVDNKFKEHAEKRQSNYDRVVEVINELKIQFFREMNEFEKLFDATYLRKDTHEEYARGHEAIINGLGTSIVKIADVIEEQNKIIKDKDK